ncbi:MAG: FAD-binding protein [Firmicutes bacterium]|nr:FAD-binding protein [Bacillota bacterium]
MTNYNAVTSEVVDKLKAIIGDKYVYTDSDKLETYSHDEVTDPRYIKMPEVVVLPVNAEEVAEIIKLANSYLIPIVPRGAGTGLACAAVPFKGGIVVSLERMNRILEIDTENMIMITEPGVTTESVQKEANEKGFLYAGDPCSGDSSFIGGNVATNAGGNKAVKYGVTRNQIAGLEMVTPSGEIITLGGKLKKDASGYSLMNLVIGSEGTLGIVTKIYLKIVALPKHTMDLLAIFKDLDSAIALAPKLMGIGVSPVCVEFMDNATIQCVEGFLREKLPHSADGYYIIVQIAGDNEEVLEDQCVLIDEIATEMGAVEVLVADPTVIWKARKAYAEADRARSLVFSMEDIVVPINKIPETVRYIEDLSKKYNVAIHCCGHAGDGNIHANILKDQHSDKEWEEILPAVQSEIYAMVYGINGKLSGEHGIGYKRVAALEKYGNPTEIKMMKAVKMALDPNLIMNPGKVISFDC